MGAVRFVRYEVRTTEVDAARAFYTEVLGDALWGPEVRVSRLPDQAIARGARPHWLGHLGVGDVEGTADRFTALGAEQLGPTMRGKSAAYGIFRDPFGAILALNSTTQPPDRDVVRWHVLHTRDQAKAFSTYAALFGWTSTEIVEVEAERARYQGFAWDGTGTRAGYISDAARSPRIHPQWLFFFPVSNLEDRLAIVRACGGLAFEPTRTPAGDLVAACDDPEGAAFALVQTANG